MPGANHFSVCLPLALFFLLTVNNCPFLSISSPFLRLAVNNCSTICYAFLLRTDRERQTRKETTPMISEEW